MESGAEMIMISHRSHFPIYHANSKYLAADCCGLAILLDHDKVEVTLVDWEREMVHNVV